MNMYNPPHPGELLDEMYIKPLELTITETAGVLDVTRQAISELVNRKRGISVEMALRLSKAFNTTPERWLNLQIQYDLWKMRNKKFPKIHSVVQDE